MATNNSQNSQFANNADGYTLGGGTTSRNLTVTGGNVTLTGAGSNTYTMPSSSDTLVGRASSDTLTNKDLTSSTNTFPNGMVVQVVNSTASAVATGTTIIPVDDTIPQNTEGDQYMSVTITPKSASNTLVIQVTAMLANTATAPYIAGAIFQDSTANAIAATVERAANASDTITFDLTTTLTAGTTSATTFKFRAGGSSAGTTTFNGQVGNRFFGAITKSSIVVWEYKS